MPPYSTPVIVLLVCSQLINVGAFSPYMRDSGSDVIDNIDFELPKTDSRTTSSEEEKVYEQLGKLLVGYLNKIQSPSQDRLTDIMLSKVAPPYLKSTNQDASSLGLKGLVEKRKVFWQPLGYLPPGARQTNTNPSRQNANNGRSNVFRYG